MAAVSRLTGVTLLAGFSSYSIFKHHKVYAEAAKIHPRELDIYAEPALPSAQEDNAEDEISALERHISVIRKQVCQVSDSFKGTRKSIANSFRTGKSRVLEFVELIQTDQTFQLKVAAITGSTVAGIALAGRGRRTVRRVLLGSALGLAAASICYPNVAVDTTVKSYNKIKEAAIKQWEEYKSKVPETAPEKADAPAAEAEVEETQEISPEPTQEPSEDIMKSEEAALTEPATTETSTEENPPVQDDQSAQTEELETKPGTEAVPVEKVEQEVTSTDTAVFSSRKSVLQFVPFYDKIKQKFQGPSTPEQVESMPIPEMESAPQDPAPEEVPVDVVELVPSEAEREEQPVKVEVQGDPGMSESEDQDMYSTRS